MTFSNGLHDVRWFLGKTDKPVPWGNTRSRIIAEVRFVIANNAIVNVMHAFVKIGLGNGRYVSIEEVDALCNDWENAKRHRRWREARLVLAPYIMRECMCVHQLASESGFREAMDKSVSVEYYSLMGKMYSKIAQIPNLLMKRLREGEVWASDEEKMLAKLPDGFSKVAGRYYTKQLPAMVTADNVGEYYKLYDRALKKAYRLTPEEMNAIPEAERPKLECPVCKHVAGNVFPQVNHPDFNSAVALLKLCEHGSRGYYPTWID